VRGEVTGTTTGATRGAGVTTGAGRATGAPKELTMEDLI